MVNIADLILWLQGDENQDWRRGCGIQICFWFIWSVLGVAYSCCFVHLIILSGGMTWQSEVSSKLYKTWIKIQWKVKENNILTIHWHFQGHILTLHQHFQKHIMVLKHHWHFSLIGLSGNNMTFLEVIYWRFWGHISMLLPGTYIKTLWTVKQGTIT